MYFNRLRCINSHISRLVSFSMMLSVGAMAVLIILSVLVRNLLGFSFQWIVDVNRLIFIWMCFMGLVYINDKDQLIRFDIIDKHFSKGLHKFFTIMRHFMSLILFGIMVKAGIDVSKFARAQDFSTIPVSTCWLYLAVVTAGILLLFQTVVKIILLASNTGISINKTEVCERS